MRASVQAPPEVPEELLPQAPEKTLVPEIDVDGPVDDKDTDILGFVDGVCNDDEPVRRAYLMDCARNLRMMRGLHWFDDLHSGRMTTSNNGFSFRYLTRADFDSDSPLPLPVTNFLGTQIENEVARIGRKEYQASASAGSTEAPAQEAAKMTQQVIEWDMKDQAWSECRSDIELEFTLFGTAVAKSEWDESQVQGTVICNPEAMSCLSCGALYADGMDPRATTDDEQLEGCVNCGAPLAAYPVAPDIAMGQQDFFGRSMATIKPQGRATISHVMMQDVFFENGGVRVKPSQVSIWGQATTREVEWIADRFPDQADQITPEPSDELIRYDLFMGDFIRLMGGNATSVYPCHARLREVHVMPRRGLPKGASIYVLNKRILGIRPLMVEFNVQGSERKHWIPRVKYGMARQKKLPGVLYGRTWVSDCVPLQRRYNEIDLMAEEERGRGFPVIAHPPGVQITPRRIGAYSVVEVSTPDDANDPRALKEYLTPTAGATGDRYAAERENILAKMREIGGPAPIESTGTAVRGGQTATGLQIEVEQREQARSPRERELKDGIFTPLWAHHVGLLAAFDTEGEAVIEDSSKAFRVKSYKSADLATGVDIKLDSKGNFDRTLFQREGVQQGIQLGFYDLSDPAAKEKARESMGLPEIPTAKGDQILLAEEAWQAWIDVAEEWLESPEEELEEHEDGAEAPDEAPGEDPQMKPAPVPVFDPITNDPGVWYSVLGRQWLGDTARKLQGSSQWDPFLRMISGWPDKLAQAEQLDAQQRQLYGGVPPQEWQQAYEKFKAQAAKMASDAAAQGQPAPQQQVVPPPMLPVVDAKGQPVMDANGQQQQQPGTFLPDPMEERIQAVWGKMCGGKIPQSVSRLLGIYSLICACWVRVKKQAEAAQMGQQQPAAPGTAPQ